MLSRTSIVARTSLHLKHSDSSTSDKTATTLTTSSTSTDTSSSSFYNKSTQSNKKDNDNGNNKITFSPENIAILMVYFVQGALGLSRLAVTFFLKDQLHLSPAETAALLGFTSIPWLIKPLYGFISDGLPFFGYRRRSYLVASGLLGCLSWLSLANFATTTTSAYLAITAGSLSIAFSDVVVDSIVVERSQTQAAVDPSIQTENNNEGTEDPTIVAAGDLQSLCWGTSSIGGIFSAYFSGSLLQTLTPQIIFGITAIFPLLISLSALLIQEEKIIASNSSAGQAVFISELGGKVKDLYRTISKPSIYLPVAFVFLWNATPTPDTAMFYYYTNVLQFPPEFLGRLRLLGSVANLLGVVLYRTYFKTMPMKNILLGCALLSVPLGISQILLTSRLNLALGIPDQAFTLTDAAVLTVLGQVSFMPILALAASLCPPGVEGTLFACLMSISNAAGTLGSELGAALTSALQVTETNFDNLSLLILICSLSNLLPLPFLNTLLKDTGSGNNGSDGSTGMIASSSSRDGDDDIVDIEMKPLLVEATIVASGNSNSSRNKTS